MTILKYHIIFVNLPEITEPLLDGDDNTLVAALLRKLRDLKRMIKQLQSD